jgi:hypothetical protein
MTEIQIVSVDAPLSRQSLLARAFGLVVHATAVGLLSGRQRVDRLDLALLREIARSAAAAGIGRDAALAMLDDDLTPSQLATLIERLDEALIGSPLPDRELRQLRQTFELEQLAALVGTSEVSLRRYLAGTREVPDAVAARAHWLALVAADLGGAYNQIGIRRWFERPRTQLEGRSPRQALGAGWAPDDQLAVTVADLAATLVGPAAAT